MTATEIDTTTQASDDTVTQAVRDARTASEWWAELTFEQRARRLDRWRGIIARRASELADVVHRDMGKPHPDAMLEIAMALEHLAWASKNARKVLGRRSVRSSLLTVNQAASVEYRPLGVIGVIGPWNYPVFTP
ncbi:aldehyde dehydrogenase family protein, partial [Rhodococcus erythropolis]|nr:aldehyde dehydrogenase family protein [Rhodococcus erythropolis]